MFVRERLLKRGGPRLKPDRTSLQLKRADCEKVLRAAQAANDSGRPLNRFITLLWETGGIDPKENARVTGKFVKRASEWARRNGYILTWVWVQEWGSAKGAHIHLLLHVPIYLDRHFRTMPLKWVKHLLPGPYIKSVLQSQKISSDFSEADHSIFYDYNLMEKLHYILKYAPAEYEAEFGAAVFRAHFSKDWGRKGRVFGKRAAVWQGWRRSLKS